MNQQGAGDQQGVTAKPHWVADMIVGVAGALAAVAVAQAALPDPRGAPLSQPRAADLRGDIHKTAGAPVDLPDFVYGEPVAGYEVVSPFGMRKLPWEKAGRLHAGVDIAAPSGYPVQATADGIVVRAGHDGGYGRFVEVEHAQGLTSLYGHLGAIAEGVEPGAAVKMGQAIGQVGNSGSSTGAHLHFEVRDRRDRPLNPQMFMGQAFATARDLPIRIAARVPRGVRIAYVSYIPRKKRALMEAEAAAAKAAAAAQLAAFEGNGAGGSNARGKSGSQAQAIQMPVVEDYKPTANWGESDPYGAGVGGDMPGWPTSGG